MDILQLRPEIDESIVEEKQRDPSLPTFSKKFDSQIYSIQFSPYEWSHDILLITFAKKICVAQVKFEDDFSFEIIGEYSNDVLYTCIALSPQTSLSVLPKILNFCTAGNDFKIRCFRSDLLNSNTCEVISGHSSYINDICFESESNYLASVSDDQTARIWDLNDSSYAVVFYLNSPGVSVCFHNEDNVKLMVCEKIGIVRFYNMDTQQPILSIENSGPISFGHWAPSDQQCVGVLQQGDLIMWDITRPSVPSHSKTIYVEGGRYMKFSPVVNLVGTINSLSSLLKVTDLESGQVKLTAPLMLPTNVTWHFRLPIICVGDDRNLYFWYISQN